MRRPLVIYDFCNCSILNFLIYEENFIFFFIRPRRRQAQGWYLIKSLGNPSKLAVMWEQPTIEELGRVARLVLDTSTTAEEIMIFGLLVERGMLLRAPKWVSVCQGQHFRHHTDKKEKQFFLIYKEI
jgi:hypothetical protein